MASASQPFTQDELWKDGGVDDGDDSMLDSEQNNGRAQAVLDGMASLSQTIQPCPPA